jgi:hypothetical protein
LTSPEYHFNFTSSELIAMQSSTSFSLIKYICFISIILFTSIFLADQSSACPFYIINTEFFQKKDSIKIDKYLLKITRNADNEYGYDIYVEKKLFIHQPTIPAIPGNSCFATKLAAEKVARKVVEKMQHGESLPTISVDELKQLGAIP